MSALTASEVLALAEALRLPISPGDLPEVTHRLNAFVEALATLAEWPLERVEPWPLLPTSFGGGEPAGTAP